MELSLCSVDTVVFSSHLLFAKLFYLLQQMVYFCLCVTDCITNACLYIFLLSLSFNAVSLSGPISCLF